MLAIETADFYAVFQAYPGIGSFDEGKGGVYGYSHIQNLMRPAHDLAPEAEQPSGWLMGRTEDDRLIPHRKTRLQERFPGNVLVVAEDNVETLLAREDIISADLGWPPSGLPAEMLYRQVRGRVIGGAVIDACAVYNLTHERPQLTYVNKLGGCSINIPSRDGSVTDQDLQRMNSAFSLRR